MPGELTGPVDSRTLGPANVRENYTLAKFMEIGAKYQFWVIGHPGPMTAVLCDLNVDNGNAVVDPDPSHRDVKGSPVFIPGSMICYIRKL